MSFNRSRVDDIDDFNDFDDKLCFDSFEAEDTAPNPMSWRKLIIEKAADNVKKTQIKKLDYTIEYTKNTLLYDEQSSKFGRVIESKPGFLSLSLISGGKIVKENVNKLEFIKQNRQDMTLSELAKNLQISEREVVSILNQIENQDDTTNLETKTTKSVKSLTTSIPKERNVPKIQASIKDKKIKIKNIKEDDHTSYAQMLPKGSTTDPVRDPNGYIKQNFALMSNKEIAVATGLSEHTIRRKLGEWGLKRKK